MGENKMEQKLSRLLDFQRFCKNQSLAQLIAQIKARYLASAEEELPDADLSLNAAGEALPQKKEDRTRE